MISQHLFLEGEPPRPLLYSISLFIISSFSHDYSMHITTNLQKLLGFDTNQHR
jgi:hypothetical protein